MCWNPKYAALLAAATSAAYFSGLYLEQKERKKINLAIILLIIFSGLIYFKYTNFFIEQLNCIRQILGKKPKRELDIILPVGISFFTFQAAGYLIDVYKREITAEKNFIRFALFISFFPQLVAGPIERGKTLLNQFDKPKTFNPDRIFHGLVIMLWGFFLKIVIADRCAIIADHCFEHYSDLNGIQLIAGACAFSFQIYCDFMGYSTIARGGAKVLGINLTDNFRMPYFSPSIKEFWKRWHISLSYWLRDYLYIPLGGSRGTKLLTYRNLLITFMISGLWHGAGWNYVCWGGLHALYIITGEQLKTFNQKVLSFFKIDPKSVPFIVFKRIYIYFLAAFAWIFFRSQNVSAAVSYIRNCLNLENIGLIFSDNISALNIGINQRDFNILIFTLAILFCVSLIREIKKDAYIVFIKQAPIFRLMCYWVLLFLIIFSLGLSNREFIYFQF
ncbi:MAG: MBOAT family protein [Alphaproteobacteria bacterium]|nr:MBOAT family protein [Alphaproteobacteria bacterium]MBO4644676.1 MBOAT family protein [Alphaproteobacteria bacterium]